MVSTTFLVLAVIAALGGGAFGAAIGALPAFVLTGILTIAGATIQIVGHQLGIAGVTDQIAPTLYVAAFGPLFGPHVSFGGGLAAHAYAAKYTDLQSQDGWPYHDAKNILIALGSNPKVLAVGALFGAGAQALKMATDFVIGMSPMYGFAHVAWVIVLSGVVHRALFGYPLIGDRKKVANRVGSDLEETSWLSFEHDEAEPIFPWQFYWSWVLVLGALIGIITGYVTIITENPWLMFGISATSLLFLMTDAGLRSDTPLAGTIVTHHITLPSAVAGLAAFQMNNPPVHPAIYAIFWAIVFGVLGAFISELANRVFYAWGDTHLDPPAFSITITVLLIVILSNLGVLGSNAYQMFGLGLF